MSAAVSNTGNGIKRSAASLDSEQQQQQAGANDGSTSMLNDSESSPPPPEKRSFIVVESPLKLGTISSAVSVHVYFKNFMFILQKITFLFKIV
jgi:hypothetical protein